MNIEKMIVTFSLFVMLFSGAEAASPSPLSTGALVAILVSVFVFLVFVLALGHVFLYSRPPSIIDTAPNQVRRAKTIETVHTLSSSLAHESSPWTLPSIDPGTRV